MQKDTVAFFTKRKIDKNGICNTCKINKSLIKLKCPHLICYDCYDTMKLFFEQAYCFQCKMVIRIYSSP